jgi:hypothetical protein
MKNENLIYIGAAALIYYLYKKNKKTVPANLLVVETPTLQALTDIDLKNLITDLQRNPSKYQNAAVYLKYATVEFNKRTGISTDIFQTI